MDKSAHEEHIARAAQIARERSTKPKPTAYITVGLPASGKTTWAKNFIEVRKRLGEKPPKRVNKDSLRAMLDFGEYSTENERVVREIQKDVVRGLLSQGCDVIIDDTNLQGYTIFWEKNIDDLATIKIVYFIDVDVDECVQRDKLRDKPVGEERIRVMSNTHKKYLKAHLRDK